MVRTGTSRQEDTCRWDAAGVAPPPHEPRQSPSFAL